jgi:hypothetical protein
VTSKIIEEEERLQKQVAQLTTNIQNVATSSNISQSVASTVAQIYSNQTITLNVGNITNSTVTLTNDSAISLLSQTFVYNSLSQLMQTQTVQSAVADMTQSAAEKNAGVSSIFKDLSGASGILAIMGYIFVGCVVLFLVFRFFKGGGFSSGSSSTPIIVQASAPPAPVYSPPSYPAPSAPPMPYGYGLPAPSAPPMPYGSAPSAPYMPLASAPYR